MEFEWYYDGKDIIFDTKDFFYDKMWAHINLTPSESGAANRLIRLYNSVETPIVITDAYHSEKPQNRALQRSQAEHYFTFEQLEQVSQNPALVARFIDDLILKPHSKWEAALDMQDKEFGTGFVYNRHPQALFTFDAGMLYELNREAFYD